MIKLHKLIIILIPFLLISCSEEEGTEDSASVSSKLVGEWTASSITCDSIPYLITNHMPTLNFGSTGDNSLSEASVALDLSDSCAGTYSLSSIVDDGSSTLSYTKLLPALACVSGPSLSPSVSSSCSYSDVSCDTGATSSTQNFSWSYTVNESASPITLTLTRTSTGNGPCSDGETEVIEFEAD
ncbi:MAG: hypothetical protein KDD58_12165 [Bdellovibrionales bacterium]|nr:hypothetical protein [Bdellovibrionales bacterium]